MQRIQTAQAAALRQRLDRNVAVMSVSDASCLMQSLHIECVLQLSSQFEKK